MGYKSTKQFTHCFVMMSVLNKQFRLARAAHMTLFSNLLIFRDDIFYSIFTMLVYLLYFLFFINRRTLVTFWWLSTHLKTLAFMEKM